MSALKSEVLCIGVTWRVGWCASVQVKPGCDDSVLGAVRAWVGPRVVARACAKGGWWVRQGCRCGVATITQTRGNWP